MIKEQHNIKGFEELQGAVETEYLLKQEKSATPHLTWWTQ
jgi:hypothetical protein